MDTKKLKIALLISAVFFAGHINAQTKKTAEIPRDTSYNVRKVYSQIRKNFPYATPALDEVPAGVIAERDVVYATLPESTFGKRELHADIFKPAKQGVYPVLIMVHGGGWRSGDKSMQVPMAEMLAAKGFVTIPVEYQLSLEAKYPAAVHNIKAAIRWVKANAARYNIDTTKVAISGCSAGGQLASLVGLTNEVKKFEGTMGYNNYSSSVHAVIDIDGVINFMAPSSLNSPRTKDSPDVQWLGGLFNEKPEIWKDASPGYWANEKSIPMLFLNSGHSRFHAGQDELIGQFKEWGTYHEVHQFNVKMHPFWLFHPWADESVNYMADFLNKVFKKPRK
ncbi:alpha/beta hydrolase [Desertivirga brevis]|uniref:alpha/beta hydrolase n=1 Tax=Desertivirga brevis TaxID=2810310 RepID=UPI001A97A091|nr:alpha/beta hydrolase [Pedobacter sp. SYSU D00873]